MSAASSVPAPRLDRAGKTEIGLLILLGVMALPSGLLLAAVPDGSVFDFPTNWLAGSPFADYFFPGLILAGLFGVGSLAVALLGLRRWWISPFLAFAIGVGQMIWIVVEVAIIRGIHILHFICFGLGLAIATLAVSWGWPVLRALSGRGARA
jgi:hypothetical protein